MTILSSPLHYDNDIVTIAFWPWYYDHYIMSITLWPLHYDYYLMTFLLYKFYSANFAVQIYPFRRFYKELYWQVICFWPMPLASVFSWIFEWYPLAGALWLILVGIFSQYFWLSLWLMFFSWYPVSGLWLVLFDWCSLAGAFG